MFRPDKKVKKKKQWKDYKKKHNIIKNEIKQGGNKEKIVFSVEFPKRRKYG